MQPAWPLQYVQSCPEDCGYMKESDMKLGINRIQLLITRGDDEIDTLGLLVGTGRRRLQYASQPAVLYTYVMYIRTSILIAVHFL